ncbi:hypothetical protein COU96_03290 [Candidatus Shapirobacteria bacterium CG10_big_fil_rev_8_21_14_0_10_38_14]|uniref:Uncharacterized protein n=1 Tax=Candidatus Shapirobacteria bacterium CG10_big_fil_rev_8_21_14_0_10_38_14 TaxID=1974483 RepID=A0A2M8L4Q0_9BACT|nr:MAG: hypothetical protein COU96_03290 [Candidatus Shapirobacteria bacterium CG10_big_fil_rev_8_21_14_0_10_38_14]
MTFSFQYLTALIATILVEFLVIAILVRERFFKIFWYFILINCFTFPLANYLYQDALPNLLLIEVFVFLVEIPLIKFLLKTKFHEALLFSFIANLTSALLEAFFFLELFI